MSFHLNWDLHGVRGYVFFVFVISTIWHRAPGKGGMKEWMLDGWMDGWGDKYMEGRRKGRKVGRKGKEEVWNEWKHGKKKRRE